MADLRHPAKYETRIIKILRFCFLYWFPDQNQNFVKSTFLLQIFRESKFFTKKIHY